MKCKKNSQHVYDDHLTSCPWCERTSQLGGYDPFPSKEAVRQGVHKGASPAPHPKSAAQTPVRPVQTPPVQTPPRPVAPARPVAPSPPRVINRGATSTRSWDFPNRGKWFLICLGIGAVIYRLNGISSSSTSSGTPTSGSYVPPVVIRMRPPAKHWVNVPIQGLWRGNFSGDPATLWIKRRQDNVFWGVLSVVSSSATSKKKHTLVISIQGTLPEQGTITMRETQVLRQYRADKWSLGTDVGTFSGDQRTMNGVGKDAHNPSYPWSFSRASG